MISGFIRRGLAVLGALAIAGALAGCGALPPVHAYDGPPRAKEDIARVTAISQRKRDTMEWTNDRLFIAAVDDRPTYDPFALTTATDPDTVYVLPGVHTFVIHWVSTKGMLTASMQFETKAGHSYLILQAIEEGKLKLWAEDVTEQQRMAIAVAPTDAHPPAYGRPTAALRPWSLP